MSLFNNKNKFFESKGVTDNKGETVNGINNSIIRLKQKDTLYMHYGVNSPMQSKEIIDKIFQTRIEHHTLTTSKIEETFYNYLKDKYIVHRQYKSEKYSYHCDFYIKDFDLYIEILGNWTHNKHPFNKDSLDDIDLLNKFLEKSKTSKFYKTAIDTWTNRDVIKRNIAKENNLNYLEIFSSKLNNAIDAFNKYLQQNEKYMVCIYGK